MSCHDAHSRTQSAPSRSAVRGSGFVCPSVWLMPVSTACAGAAHTSSADSTTAPASRERRPITFKVSAQRSGDVSLARRQRGSRGAMMRYALSPSPSRSRSSDCIGSSPVSSFTRSSRYATVWRWA